MPLGTRAPGLKLVVDVGEAAFFGAYDGPNFGVGEELRAVPGAKVPLCLLLIFSIQHMQYARGVRMRVRVGPG